MKITNNQVVLCCGRKGCPTVSLRKDGTVCISDDFGGSVRLEEDEAQLITKAIKELKKK